MGPRREKIGFNSGVPIQFLPLLKSVLNFRRVTGLLDLGECLSLKLDNLPSAVYLSSLQTPQPSNENLGLGIGVICRDIQCQLCENVSLLKQRRVTGKLDLGECLSLDVYNLPSAVYLSPVETPPTSNDGYCMFVQF